MRKSLVAYLITQSVDHALERITWWSREFTNSVTSWFLNPSRDCLADYMGAGSDVSETASFGLSENIDDLMAFLDETGKFISSLSDPLVQLLISPPLQSIPLSE